MSRLDLKKIGYVKKFIVVNKAGSYLKEGGTIKLFNTKIEADKEIEASLSTTEWVTIPVKSEVVKVEQQDRKCPERVYGYSISLGDTYLTDEDGGLVVSWTLSEALRSMEEAVNKVMTNRNRLPLDPPNMVLVVVDKVELMGDINS